MERRDRGVRVSIRHELVHSRLHLVRGFVREGERKDLGGPGSAGRDQPGYTASDDLRLARAGPGDDKQRTLAVTDRAPLLLIEPGKKRLDALRCSHRFLDRIGRRPPDRYLFERGLLNLRCPAIPARHGESLSGSSDISRVTSCFLRYRRPGPAAGPCPGLRSTLSESAAASLSAVARSRGFS